MSQSAENPEGGGQPVGDQNVEFSHLHLAIEEFRHSSPERPSQRERRQQCGTILEGVKTAARLRVEKDGDMRMELCRPI